jgi:hypothetical protein
MLLFVYPSSHLIFFRDCGTLEVAAKFYSLLLKNVCKLCILAEDDYLFECAKKVMGRDTSCHRV